MTDRGGVSRRDFLRLGLAAGPASLVAACGWDGGAALEPRLRAFSRINDWVGEKIFLSRSRLTIEMLEGLPRVSYTVKHHCVEGWTAIGTWSGVPVSVVSELVRPLPEARYLRFDSFDSGYSNGWDLASAMHPQTILAYAYNDRPLSREHGAPLRLYSPIKLGYKLTKYVTAMSFTRERHGGYWEDQGYPWLAGVYP